MRGTVVGILSVTLHIFCSAQAQAQCSTDDADTNGIPDDCPSGYNYIAGGPGSDTLNGTSGNDCIYGLSGGDTINGLGGDDYLCGGSGNDTINGGDGDDELYGETGDDILDGGANDDLLDGGNSNDNLFGGTGIDTLQGGPGNDTLSGGDGSDTLNCSGGTDTAIDDGDTINSDCESQLNVVINQISQSAFDPSTWNIGLVTAFGTKSLALSYRPRNAQPWVPLTIIHIPPVFHDRVATFQSGQVTVGDRVRIVEQTIWGNLIDHGSFELRKPKELERQPPPTIANASLVRLAKNNVQDGRSRGVAIHVDEPGGYQVDYVDIAQTMGVEADTIRRAIEEGQLSLKQHGQPIAWKRGPDGSLHFVSAGRKDNPISGTAVYTLEFARGELMRSGALAPATSDLLALSFRTRKRFEKDVFPGPVVSPNPNEDLYFWHGLSSVEPNRNSARFEFTLDGYVVDSVELRVHLHGASANLHTGYIVLNQHTVGSYRFEGMTRHEALVLIDPELILKSQNKLEILATQDPGESDPHHIYVDAFELHYSRLPVTDRPSLFFSAGTDLLVRLGTKDPIELFDVTDFEAPVMLAGVSRTGNHRPNHLDEPVRNYLAIAASGWKTPTRIAQWNPIDVTSVRDGAQYIILAPPHLLPGAKKLAYVKRAQGISVKVVSSEAVFDRFSSGLRDPKAVREFLAHAKAHWNEEPEYLALVGTGHLDYRQLITSEENWIPPALVQTDYGLYASDQFLASQPGQGDSGIKVGRIPVTTNEELANYVSALEAFESGDLDARVISEGTVAGLSIDRRANQMRAWLGSQKEPLLSPNTVGSEAITAAIRSMWKNAPTFVNFVGHGSLDRFGKDKLLGLGDLIDLSPGPSQPIVITWSCNTGRFEVPGQTSIAESLLRQGKAVMVLAPTGLVNYHDLNRYAEPLLRGLAGGSHPTVGLAMAEARRRARASGYRGEILSVFGDPALLLREKSRPLTEAPGTASQGDTATPTEPRVELAPQSATETKPTATGCTHIVARRSSFRPSAWTVFLLWFVMALRRGSTVSLRRYRIRSHTRRQK